eukprot:Gb_08629 [translate_table: standard]
MATSEVHAPTMEARDAGIPVASRRAPLHPSRSPPPPPSMSKEQDRRSSPVLQPDLKAMHGGGGSGSPLGAFWSTQYAHESQFVDDKGPVFDKDSGNETAFKQRSHSPETHPRQGSSSPPKDHHSKSAHLLKKSGKPNVIKKVHGLSQPTSGQGYDETSSELYQLRLGSEDMHHSSEDLTDSNVSTVKVLASESGGSFQDHTFNAFVAEFEKNKSSSGTIVFGKEDLEAEVDRLKEELEQVRSEKAEITSKYEKLTAICRSQRQEIQELKQTLTSFNKESSGKSVASPQTQLQQPRQRSSSGSWQSGSQQQDKIEGSIWELQESMSSSSLPMKAPDANAWQAFAESQTTQFPSKSTPLDAKMSGRASSGGHDSSDSTRTGATNGIRRQQHVNAATAVGVDTWGFVQDSFTSMSTNLQASKASGQVSSQFEGAGSPAVYDSNNAKPEGRSSRSVSQSQPAGWAGF